MLEDSKGQFWVGTRGGGLNLFDPENKQFIHFKHDDNNPSSLAENTLYKLFEDQNGAIWISTFNGLNRYDPSANSFELVQYNASDPRGLSSNSIAAFTQDNEGFLWIGTHGGGLNRVYPGSPIFQQVRKNSRDKRSSNLSDDLVHSLHKDNNGGVWIGTESGLNYLELKTGKVTHYTHNKGDSLGINKGGVRSIDVDQQGQVWLTLYGGGLSKLNPKTGLFYHYVTSNTDGEGVATEWLNSVLVDSTGLIWTGGDGGLSQFNPKESRFKNYYREANKGLSNATINSLFEDKAGNIWIGTNDGLNRYHQASDSFSLHQDPARRVGNMIMSIVEDDLGMLWLGTDKGLAKFNPKTDEFKFFNVVDGMQGSQFARGAAFKDNNGLLYFGGANGYNVLNPYEFKENSQIPEVVFTEFLLFNRKVDIGEGQPLKQAINLAKQITLEHEQSVFTIKFAALNYRLPEKNQYAYKLEGFDKEWRYVDAKHRVAAYTNLDPGEYSFKVKASNNDGIWNVKGAAIKLVIIPPWWQTLWFKGLLALFFVGLVPLVFLRRLYLVSHQKKRLEKQVAERTRALVISTKKAQSANVAKSTFLASMSHELRTPLNAILGFSQLLEQDPEITPEQRDSLLIINNSGKHLLTLINDVLDMSKIEAGQIELQAEVCDLHQLLDDVSNMIVQRAEARGLAYSLDKDPNLIRYIELDPGKLRQILLNLLGNSVKYTDSGSIRLRVHSHMLDDGLCHLSFLIKDTGRGISKEEQEKVFDAFVQVTSAKGVSEGTGLGLSITKKYIKLMGGDISVLSKVGQGSVFQFHVQAKQGQNSQVSHYQPTEKRVLGLAPGQQKFRILIVEDNDSLRLLLKSILVPAGFVVQEACDGEQAVVVFKKWLPDLIWMDICMPVMDGYEATRKIKALKQGKHTPILAVTASVYSDKASHIKQAGFDDYLLKPYREHEIFELMARHLELKYQYQQQTPLAQSVLESTGHSLAPEQIQALPVAIRQNLHNASLRLDSDLIQQAIQQISEFDPKLSQQLQALAERFDYEQLQQLTKVDPHE